MGYYALAPILHGTCVMQVGRGLGVALLDLYGLNPMSRLPNTEFGSLDAMRASLVERVRAVRAKAEATKATLNKG